MTGKELRPIREAAGLSARALSLAIGHHESYISSMETRNYEFSPSIEARIKSALKGTLSPGDWQFRGEKIDAERLRLAVAETGKPIAVVADEMELSRAQLYRYLNAQSTPSQEAAETIAAYLGVSLDWLFGYGSAVDKVGFAKVPTTMDNNGVADIDRRRESECNLSDFSEGHVGVAVVTMSTECFKTVKDLLYKLDAGLAVRLL